MLYIYRSNHLEELQERLAEIISVPQSRVLTPETIIVQSQGMARWLSLRLAQRLGVSANLDCAFPAAFIWRLINELQEDVSGTTTIVCDGAAFEPDSMVWGIMELLALKVDDPDFKQVAGYLSNDLNSLNRYQLSLKLAELFDKYMAYRPDWFEQWPQDADKWQADLWAGLVERYGNAHRVFLQDNLIRHLTPAGACNLTAINELERLSIFGIPALPPSQFTVFEHLADLCDLHLFLLTPCREFWTDFVSAKTMVKASLASGGLDPEADLHFEGGCPLLVSMGSVGREFQITLQEAYAKYQEDDFFIEPELTSNLSLIQDDILNGRSPDDDIDLKNIPHDDKSIMIHVSHSPMREVEILYDQLLNLLNDSDLVPGDILVMTPDINVYSPLVEAVFSNSAETAAYDRSHTAIPYSVADAPVAGEIIQAFLALLELNDRAGASEVLALIQYEPIREHFGINTSDMDTISNWIRKSGIKWGLTAHITKSRQGSWLAGLERLLMGYIYGGDGLAQVTGQDYSPTFLADLLPCDILEGGDGNLLAAFLNFISSLQDLLNCPPRSLSNWSEFFGGLLDVFFTASDDNLQQIQIIRQYIDEIKQAAIVSGISEKISSTVAKTCLKEKLNTSRDSGNFLCSRVTFCQMAPMRSIPFPVICLLGMNDNDFPRHDRPLSFDLTTKERRLGDRSRRADDRYLFLETIISSRRNLYISYIGMSDQDSRQLPPSVLVSELMDHLTRRLRLTAEEATRRFITFHPLQPFSKRYFRDNLFSYCQLNRQIAGNLGADQPWRGIFTNFNNPSNNKICDVISVDNFIDFFSHPARYIMRHRFGVNLDDYYDELEDREPFGVDPLMRYKITRKIIDNKINHNLEDKQILLAEQQQGELPDGEMGQFYFAENCQVAANLAEQLKAFHEAEKYPKNIQLSLENITLKGDFDSLTAIGQYFYRPIAIKAMKYKDYIKCWIHHLLLSALHPELNLATYFVGLDKNKEWLPLARDEAIANLRQLVKVFIKGQSMPLPIYPRTTFDFAKKYFTGKNHDKEAAFEKAQEVWEIGGFNSKPENSDPYLLAVFGLCPNIPQTSEFEKMAKMLLGWIF